MGKVIIFAQFQVELWLTFKADEMDGTRNTRKDNDTN